MEAGIGEKSYVVIKANKTQALAPKGDGMKAVDQSKKKGR